jgi:hypothetical protein
MGLGVAQVIMGVALPTVTPKESLHKFCIRVLID